MTGRKIIWILLPAVFVMSININSAESENFALKQFSFPVDNGWHITCVECQHYFPELGEMLALTQDGHPHLVYGGDHLYHAWLYGGFWVTEVVDSSPNVGHGAALDIDEQGNLHVSYYDARSGNLKYAYRDSAGWHRQVVDSSVDVGLPSSIALDSQGGVHISYTDVAHDQLKYAYFDEEFWDITVVDSLGGAHSSIAIGLDGYPRISYTVWAAIKYAWKDSSGWHWEYVDIFDSNFPPLDGVWGHSTLVVAENGRTHVGYAYTNLSQLSTLNYASRDATGWQILTLDDRGEAWLPSLAIENDGDLHLSYSVEGALIHAYQVGTAWEFKFIDNEWFESGASTIRSDWNGNLHVGYFYLAPGGPTELRYQVIHNYGGSSAVVDTMSVPGDFPSLAIDDQGSFHVSYAENIGPDNHVNLKYAHEESSTWQIDKVDEWLGLAGRQSAIAVDETFSPHIVYNDAGAGIIRYTTMGAVDWQREIIYDAGSNFYTYEAPSIALDSEDAPHAAFILGGLHYAYRTESGWQDETLIDSLHQHSPRLALNSGDKPQISYILDTGVQILYHDSHGWHNDGVAIPGDLSWGNFDFKLDQNADAHVVLRDKLPFTTIWYAHRVSGEWQLTQLAGWEDPESLSLALSDTGDPHICFMDEGALVYGFKSSGIWSFQIIRQHRYHNQDQACDIELDDEGRPMISFLDLDTMDLKIAKSVEWVSEIHLPMVNLKLQSVRFTLWG